MNRALMLQVEKNFEEFLNYVRINRAAELLLTTDQTVTYIAMEVGYANVKTFNRNFLRFKVMTPGDFRKKVCASGKSPIISFSLAASAVFPQPKAFFSPLFELRFGHFCYFAQRSYALQVSHDMT